VSTWDLSCSPREVVPFSTGKCSFDVSQLSLKSDFRSSFVKLGLSHSAVCLNRIFFLGLFWRWFTLSCGACVPCNVSLSSLPLLPPPPYSLLHFAHTAVPAVGRGPWTWRLSHGAMPDHAWPSTAARPLDLPPWRQRQPVVVPWRCSHGATPDHGRRHQWLPSPKPISVPTSCNAARPSQQLLLHVRHYAPGRRRLNSSL
jgi:hypothetical protein